MTRDFRKRPPVRDVRGQKLPERISEYFDFERFPDKTEKAVTRIELLAILTQMERGKKEQRWIARLWRFLRRPVHSGPVPATEPTAGEVARGEATPT
jgi:hypothetical protein